MINFIHTLSDEYIAVETIARLFEVIQYAQDELQPPIVVFQIETKRGHKYEATLASSQFVDLIGS